MAIEAPTGTSEAPLAQIRGDPRTLFACFLHFDVSFMLWVLPGALGVFIAESLRLSASEKGFVVAAPILSGALLRVPAGLFADRFGAKRVGLFMLVFLFLPLSIGWQLADSFVAWVATGLMLGCAGASFAVALPLASRCFPPERHGLVMGIAAAGNSGTVIANLAAPRLAGILGWHNVLLAAMAPLAVALITFVGLAREPRPTTPHSSPRRLFAFAREPDLLRFCALYAVTFGGYVGLAAFFPLLLRSAYGLRPVDAGYLTAAVAVAGSAVRPLGGYLADRAGGLGVLAAVFTCLVALHSGIAVSHSLTSLMVLAVLLFLCLGIGNGAVFQLVPRRFPAEVGVATGLVGAVGGLGGFLLPNLLAGAEGLSGSFAGGFLALALIALGALGLLRSVAPSRERGRARSPELGTGRVAMAPYLS